MNVLVVIGHNLITIFSTRQVTAGSQLSLYK